jgi:ribosomal protein S18 acetylase RimI-like enzyme
MALGLRALQQRGVSTVRLHTVSEFPTRAKNLYGSVGFHVRKAFPRYRKPKDVDSSEANSTEGRC